MPMQCMAFSLLIGLMTFSAANLYAEEKINKRVPGDELWPRGGQRIVVHEVLDPVTRLETRPAKGRDAWFVLESAAVSFGDLVQDADRELPAAVTIRVFSNRYWILKLVSDSPLQVLDQFVSLSRLAWRTGKSGMFAPLKERRPITIAQGPPTSRGGKVVAVDLRFHLEPDDPTGRYIGNLRVILE